MSFAFTEAQILDRSKTVTRRFGWLALRVGDELRAVRKTMGRKPGEAVVDLAVIRVVGLRREPISAITDAEAEAEGFPEMTGAEFIETFCGSFRATPETEVTRIEFEYVETHTAGEDPR